MSQERPHNLRRRRFLQQTPGEFVPRNLYPFCKLKDLLSRQIPSSEERKQHHEAIGSDKTSSGKPSTIVLLFLNSLRQS
jgi:hypothetical protein